MNELHIIFLYVVTFGLVIYGLRKDMQYQREKRLNEFLITERVASMIQKGLRKKLAEAKGLTEEEFNKSWGGK